MTRERADRLFGCAPSIKFGERLLGEEFQNFRRMSAGISDWNPMLLDRAVRSDERGRTDGPLRHFALGVFARSPGAVGFHRVFLRIGQQDERQIELADEIVMGIDAIGADADDDGIGLGNGIDSVAEPARFLGSARGVVFRIKPQNYIFARVFAERVLLAVTPCQCERRRLLTFKTCHLGYLRFDLVHQCLSHQQTDNQSFIRTPVALSSIPLAAIFLQPWRSNLRYSSSIASEAPCSSSRTAG